MPAWIFQGNPDKFNIDEYLTRTSVIRWLVRQEHLAAEMRPGDDVFIWRSAGKAKAKAGIVAFGKISTGPEELPEDEASGGLWLEDSPLRERALRVGVRIESFAAGPKEVVQRGWLIKDPALSHMRILRFASETNYKLSSLESRRLRELFTNTGRNWNRDESLAGLWAYAKTKGKVVSQTAGQPVAIVSERIGRAITGVYNKVMNFRAIDASDPRAGLPAGSKVDEMVWEEFFDPETELIDSERLDKEFQKLWGKQTVSKPSYEHFGDAPDDDPAELQQFSARVRRGQPEFRTNLLTAYAECCAISGSGPSEVLEAVHIVPHAESGVNALDNGLPIRADLHHLFDAGLLRIHPDTFEVRLSVKLDGSDYWIFNGSKLRPRVDGTYPNPRYRNVSIKVRH